MVNFGHPANRGIIAYLSADTRQKPDTKPQASPADIKDPYYNLGTHPEIVERLWDDLAGVLSKNCRWILYGTPVLVHHASGVVFGFAGGSQTYALRLPPPERAIAIAAGAAFQVVVEVGRYVARNAPGGLRSGHAIVGFVLGIATMFVTGVLVG